MKNLLIIFFIVENYGGNIFSSKNNITIFTCNISHIKSLIEITYWHLMFTSRQQLQFIEIIISIPCNTEVWMMNDRALRKSGLNVSMRKVQMAADVNDFFDLTKNHSLVPVYDSKVNAVQNRRKDIVNFVSDYDESILCVSFVPSRSESVEYWSGKDIDAVSIPRVLFLFQHWLTTMAGWSIGREDGC